MIKMRISVKKAFLLLAFAQAVEVLTGCGGGGKAAPTSTPLEVNREAISDIFRTGQHSLEVGGQPLLVLGLAMPTRDAAAIVLGAQALSVRLQDVILPLEVRVPGGLLTGTVIGSLAQYTAQVSGQVQLGPVAGQAVRIVIQHEEGQNDEVSLWTGQGDLQSELSIFLSGDTVVSANGTFFVREEEWTLDGLTQTLTGEPRTLHTIVSASSELGNAVDWELTSTPQVGGRLQQVTTATFTKPGGAAVSTRQDLTLTPVDPQTSIEPPKPDGTMTFRSGDGVLESTVEIVDGQPTSGEVFKNGQKIGSVAFADGFWKFLPADGGSTPAFEVGLDAQLLISAVASLF